MSETELKEFLDEKVAQYNRPSFLSSDPIQIPHLFTKKEDIEIAAFLVATIAWGNRKSILKNGKHMMELLDHDPYDKIMHAHKNELSHLNQFVHRTFNGTDFTYFVHAIKNIYTHHRGLEPLFSKHSTAESTQQAISEFKSVFFELPHPERTRKHISDPRKNSAAKRLNMFLRWMVRKDPSGVDFGIWDSISTSALSCPLDVHSGNVARKLGLLQRKQNDSAAVLQLDNALRKLDSNDPVKYDFALFGLGVFEGF